MFGKKNDKQTRLEKLATLIEETPGGVTQADLARELDVPRSTVLKDLPLLEEAGVMLAEDAHGRLTLFGRRKSSTRK
jgi:Mn-dependent DtxR family transcriptional regulator